MSHSLLVIDDAPDVCAALGAFFRRRGWQVASAGSFREGIETYERDRPDVVLLDLELPGISGLQLLEVLRQRDPDATVVMLTGCGDVATAVEAMRLGAENFLAKPADLVHLEAAVTRAYEKAELRRHNRFFRDRQTKSASGLEALGREPAMAGVARQIDLLAGGTAPVLLTGETGTGKGWVANLLHSLSPRAGAPFVEVNCAGLTSTFLDSELFGHEKGAFTDAKAQKRGLFEVADGGTLFLDEIGDLAPELQPKLLKVLESQRFRRLGGTRELTVDVRLVAATHHDLQNAVAAGRFREDLFYRLAVLPLHLPALRDRGRETVVTLAHELLEALHRKLGRGPTRFSAEALGVMVQHPWPGNIRELRNTLERVLLLAGDAEEILVAHLPPALQSRAASLPEPAPGGLADDFSLAAAEHRHITRVVAHFGGNRARAARALGITRGTLYNKLREPDAGPGGLLAGAVGAG